MLVWKKNTGKYLQNIKSYDLLSIKKHEQYYKREFKKLASTIKVIVNMFLAQIKKINIIKYTFQLFLYFLFFFKKYREKKTKFKSQTWAVHNLNKLLYLKTIQNR